MNCEAGAERMFPGIRHAGGDYLVRALGAAVTPVIFLLARVDLLFLAMLTAMLFRPPDFKWFAVDRMLLVAFAGVAGLRLLALRTPVFVYGPVTWPMLGLLLITVAALLSQPYDPQNWSVWVAKWLVPAVCFHLAGPLLADAISWRRVEVFSWLVLSYLCVVSLLFLAGANGLIFPRYIVDESLGIHADRARGPFLQAVANGVSLNLLGLLALDCFRRKKLLQIIAVFLLIAVPLAILATKTRAVWLSFAVSIVGVLLISHSPRVRRACGALLLLACLGIAAIGIAASSNSFGERLEDNSPVAFRAEMYQAGWDMYLEKPLLGWNADEAQMELGKRVTGFHPEMYIVHNTYLAIAVEQGTAGLALYGFLIFGLYRLRRIPVEGSPPSIPFRWLWPVLLAVYLINASVVVMQYQFVNGVVFTLAGMLAAENRSISPKRSRP